MTKFAFWIAALGGGARFECGECAKHDLTSSDLKEGDTIVNEQVFKGFGCTGGNVSPDLSWSGAPSRTKSFAVSIFGRADRRLVATGLCSIFHQV
jgi:hypothetical protein